MRYIDPHIHMVSRTTDDYMRMALAGCVCITEPAFWNGFDRGDVEGFRDYFMQHTMGNAGFDSESVMPIQLTEH